MLLQKLITLHGEGGGKLWISIHGTYGVMFNHTIIHPLARPAVSKFLLFMLVPCFRMDKS